MTFEHPQEETIPQLLQLWQTAFGEYNGFWDLFLETAFSPQNCRCITEHGTLLATLTWLDGECHGQEIAYLYAVATDHRFQGRGLCRKLLADTHALLKSRGYTAAMLVPEGEGLRQMYRKLGYTDCTTVREFSCDASPEPAILRAIGPTEYAALRRQALPQGGVIQEGSSLDFLARQVQFYAGADFLLAAYQEDGVLTGMELLGNAHTAPGILRALDCQTGTFRTPGTGKAFAMLCPLTPEVRIPAYFGFAFD